jgi:hypothetical protein
MITLPNGQQVEASVLTFRTTNEDFSEYLLDDGTVVKLKVVVTDVARVEGIFDPQGNPLYIVQSTNVMSVDAPNELRKGGDHNG